jgi:hypothetical protein
MSIVAGILAGSFPARSLSLRAHPNLRKPGAALIQPGRGLTVSSAKNGAKRSPPALSADLRTGDDPIQVDDALPGWGVSY